MAELKNLSKNSYNVSEATFDSIRTSALMRIADSCELMSKNYLQLQHDLNYYKRLYEEKRDIIEKLNRRISTMRGHITRLKNKLNSQPNVQVSDTTEDD